MPTTQSAYPAITAEQQALLQQYAQSQYLQQQAMSIGTAIGGAWSTSTGAAQTSPEDLPRLYDSFYNWNFGVQQNRQTIKFNRINEVVEIAEGGEIAEPLDELRIKVARWLYN